MRAVLALARAHGRHVAHAGGEGGVEDQPLRRRAPAQSLDLAHEGGGGGRRRLPFGLVLRRLLPPQPRIGQVLQHLQGRRETAREGRERVGEGGRGWEKAGEGGRRIGPLAQHLLLDAQHLGRGLEVERPLVELRRRRLQRLLLEGDLPTRHAHAIHMRRRTRPHARGVHVRVCCWRATSGCSARSGAPARRRPSHVISVHSSCNQHAISSPAAAARARARRRSGGRRATC